MNKNRMLHFGTKACAASSGTWQKVHVMGTEDHSIANLEGSVKGSTKSFRLQPQSSEFTCDRTNSTTTIVDFLGHVASIHCPSRYSLANEGPGWGRRLKESLVCPR